MVVILLILIILLLSFLIVGSILAPILERRDFNNGMCVRCGKKLKNFDMDSQGGRGYTCDNCGYTTWVSYKRVDKDFKKQ